MNTNEERKVFFDDRAQGWEERNYSQDKRERLAVLVKAFHLQAGSRILDVGAGEGVLIPYLRESIGASGQIIALDSSEMMLKGAAQKENGSALVLLSGAESMPLISEYIDTVVCFAAFPHFSDKEKAVAEFYRVLRPNGKVYVAHLMNREELSKHHGTHHAVCGDHLPCPVGMKKLFETAGFGSTSLEERSGWYLFEAKKE